MSIGIVGRKCGMTRVFTDEGVSIPVTVVEAEPNRITQVKSSDSDGYSAIQVTTGSRKASRVAKAQAGHYAKAGVEAGRGLWEFRTEGADEVFGGSLYFHMAPDAKEFHEETVRKVLDLHKYDCARANKSMMAWGIEARVPFLDRSFIDYAMNLDPEAKRAPKGGLEKEPIRQAFEGLLPEGILRRQKEQFSDGVGYGWIDTLKAQAEARVSDADLARAASRFPINPPTTKEGYWYREMFEQHYPTAAAASTVPGGKSVACSTEKALEWDARLQSVVDPSGRAVTQVHKDGYKDNQSE